MDKSAAATAEEITTLPKIRNNCRAALYITPVLSSCGGVPLPAAPPRSASRRGRQSHALNMDFFGPISFRDSQPFPGAPFCHKTQKMVQRECHCKLILTTLWINHYQLEYP